MWGNLIVHVISHLQDRIILSAGVKFCHVNVSMRGNSDSGFSKSAQNSLLWWLCIIIKGNNRKSQH